MPALLSNPKENKHKKKIQDPRPRNQKFQLILGVNMKQVASLTHSNTGHLLQCYIWKRERDEIENLQGQKFKGDILVVGRPMKGNISLSLPTNMSEISSTNWGRMDRRATKE